MDQKNIKQKLAQWNNQMVKKYHSKGTLFESKNILLRTIEKMRLKKIIQLAQLHKNDLVLDLGCGEGFLISLIADSPKKVVGLDISKIALNRAKEILKDKKKVELRWGNAEALSLPNESFDKIICSEMLEHTPQPRKAMEEIYRVLKNNGLLIISVPDEKRIQSIMKMGRILNLNKYLNTCREKEKYEWHLHQANKKFITNISKGLFKIQKIYRTPPIIGYRLVATLIKNERTPKGILDKKYHRDRKIKLGPKYRLKRRTSEAIEAIKKYHPRNIASILDIGTADGLMLSQIKTEFPRAKCIGLEYSKELIDLNQNKSIKIIQGNAQILPFPDNSFDITIATAIIEHLNQPMKMLKEAYRVLKKEGVIILTTPDPFWDKIAQKIGYQEKEYHNRLFNLRKLNQMFRVVKLETVMAEKFMLSPIGFPFELKIEKLLKRLKLDFVLVNQIIVGRK